MFGPTSNILILKQGKIGIDSVNTKKEDINQE